MDHWVWVLWKVESDWRKEVIEQVALKGCLAPTVFPGSLLPSLQKASHLLCHMPQQL